VIRVAVMGAGHWGPNLIRNFHNHERSEVAWVVDRAANRLAEVRARFPEVRTDPDVGAALADPAVDAVVIATPTGTHYRLARLALEQGKHVLVEKPMATTLAEAEELAALAAARARVLMVGHVFLYNPAVRRVKEYLDAGRLGSVYYVSMVRTNLGPIRVDVNAAWDLAAHDVSIANYWLDGMPLGVTAVGGTWINRGVEDAVFATLRYPSDVLVNLHVSWLNPRKAREITVVGDRHMLTFDDTSLTEPIRLYDKQVTEDRSTYIDSFASYRAGVREGEIVIPRVPPGEPLRTECEHFLDCIISGQRPLTDGVQGAGVVRVLEALQRALQSGTEQSIAS
jgi:predicted dehydrogenase